MSDLIGTCIFHTNCFDECHVWLSFVVLTLCAIALIGLTLLLIYIFSCIEHTAQCNKLAHENYRRLLDFDSRLREVENSAKRNGVRK